MVDWAFLTFLLTAASLALTFLFRKRILAALGRLLFDGAVKFARREFLVEEVSEGEDGVKRVKIGLSAPAKAIVEALAPQLLAASIKNIKINVPELMKGMNLPSVGANELGQALMGGVAQKALSGKKLKGEDIVQGILGLILPRAQGFLSGLGMEAGAKPGAPATKNPFLKELEP